MRVGITLVPMTRQKLDKVLKNLKKNKASDPHGLINEIFHINAIGDDLKDSLFLLYKRMKEELIIPEVMEFVNITSIYKGKGLKNDLNNKRGIFGINIQRSILLKVIHNYEYENIDSQMSDSNVGGRKRKNIRNHLFIVNGIINESIRMKKEIDIEILDYKVCGWRKQSMTCLRQA